MCVSEVVLCPCPVLITLPIQSRSPVCPSPTPAAALSSTLPPIPFLQRDMQPGVILAIMHLSITSRYCLSLSLVLSRPDTDLSLLQDPESHPAAPPSFLLRLSNEDELTFHFTCVLRQLQTGPVNAIGDHLIAPTGMPTLDTNLTGLTYIFASNPKEIDQLVTREFHADPNLHRNPNVALVGDFNTSGVPSVQFQWSWKWRPPKQSEDLGGGWRNTCSVSLIHLLLVRNMLTLSSVRRIQLACPPPGNAGQLLVLGEQ